MDIHENNFLIYAAHFYNNVYCEDDKEFFDDLKRLTYLKKMFNVFEKTGEININLVLNHIIILYNVFDRKACTKILFFKLPEYWSHLKSVVYQLGYMPDSIRFNETNILDTAIIPFNKEIFESIRKILNAKVDY